MTSRPSAPAQRSLSGNNVLQRPSQHRTLSQQFPSSSPTRRNNESFVDLTFEGSDAAPGRYGGAPRIGGSRLKLEITKDSRHSAHAESPKPILDAPPLWKPSVPLRGRPQLHSELPDGLSSGAVQQGPSEVLPLRPMPMPVRPGQHSPPNRDDKPRVAPGNTPKKDGRPKPYSLEVPAAAPRYTPNGHADFFPWTGNHPEDQFSETVIRQGFFDKTQMTQNETGTARASIFPALKHKTGLQTLSSLFTGVLAQRRAHGQITSNSSFKPPPRVTVTDTKREVWLKDLANPTISLRRLSRSIPHGVRGKILLDQALSKNIPIERTVWLAKCVGANELRSFRRKGVSGTFAMGGEAKWIRDFTVNVEQFMESIIGSCGEKGFKNRINYAIRLSTHFHAEHLLDREHFMDWLVSSLENSLQAKLPVWLLITQIYWKDLLKYRKYGRRLSATILGHFTDTVVHEDRDIMGPLLDRLRILLRGLMISNPESFVSPVVWTKHRNVLQSNLDSNDQTLLLAFTIIDTRNGRLTAPGTEKQLSPRQQLIEQLDMLFSKPYTNEMSTQYWHLSDKKEMLIRTVLEWSTSSHRPGFAKIFVGTRIIRSWSRNGAAVTEAILSFLESTACETGRCRSSVYHLISELARSEHFSTPAYLQWLIARGGLYDATEVMENGPLATRLLAELPIHNVSEAIISLRSTLLHRAGFDVDDEDERTKACMCLIDKALPGMQTNMNSEAEIWCAYSVDHFEDHLPKLSRTCRAEIGLWLREKVAHQVLRSTVPRIDGWSSSPGKNEISPITASELSTVRHYLELMGDFSMLADVLRIATSSNDPDVLSSIADSLDLHLECFAAVGALKGLFEILLTRLRSVFEDHDSLPRVFLASLASLAGRMPEQKVIAEQLAQELARSDRKTAADACSPVSDHMAGVLQVEEADFTDEIEKVLASGNSMDKATLERLFQRIISRLEASWGKSMEQQRSCGLLLTRLKTFDALHFDTLITAWVHRFQQMSIRPNMTEVFAPLISFGCLDLSNTSVNMVPKNGALELDLENHIALRNSREALSLAILPSNIPGLMTTEEAYRFRIRQTHLQKDHPTEILSLIRRAVEHSSSSDTPNEATGVLDILETLEARQAVQRLVVVDTESTSQILVLPLCNSGSHKVLGAIESLVDGLLVPGLEKPNFEGVRTEIVLGLANDLTLPFCRLKLASMFSSKRSLDIDRTAATRLEAFQNAIEAAVSGGSTTWASIVPLMDVPIAQHLRSKAQLQFLASFPSLKSAATYDLAKSKDQITQAKNLLYIIDATAYNGPYTGTNPSALPAEIVGTLQNTWLLLSHSQYFVLRQEVVTQWLPLLVSFSAYHASAFEPSKTGNELRVKALLALAALLLELGALDIRLETINGLIEQTFDLTLVLVDSLPDDLRHYCIRSLKDSISNPRLRYLFSYAGNPSDWLILSQKDKASLSSTLGVAEARTMDREKLIPFPLRRWEMLGVDPESGPKSYLNDTSLSLTLFGARKS